MRTFLWILLTLWACSGKEISDVPIYEGPLQEYDSIEVLYSEFGKVQVKLIAPKLFDYESGDREFPDGLNMEFFDDSLRVTSTLRCDQAYYNKTEDEWKGTGNVVVYNIEYNQELNTEELYWDPDREIIYTDKFVTIKLENEVLYGRGLEAKQDFSSYTIRNPEGEFLIEDEPATTGNSN